MRLLEYKDGDISLTKNFISDIPPYAILSHTWGDDDEEVSFEELLDGSGKTKSGYKKIQFCGIQAFHDNLRYFWIDTCCICKSSSSELSEAINSMFKWYSNAAICYAYLSDVSFPGLNVELAFLKSRWFTRGWTLQELIAPKVMHFYDSDWCYIGSKETLGSIISRVTAISLPVITDVDKMWSTSVACRMSWAAKRNTTRIEDTAYCLLGIFGVNMPLLYGEGDKAFLRLQEEIIKISDDQSIFAWDAKELRNAALAQKPLEFSTSWNVVPIPPNPNHGTFSMTHMGLRIQLPMLTTTAYFGSAQVYIGLLNCQLERDFSNQIAIFLCETATSGIYTRCLYRGAYFGTVELHRAAKAELRSLYIESHTRSSYRLQPRLYCRLSHNSNLPSPFEIKVASVNGVQLMESVDREGLLMGIERTEAAHNHDLAIGFILHSSNTNWRSGFIVAVYFPHKSFVTDKLSGVRIYDKPQDWAFEQWLESSSADLSTAHIQASVATVSKECNSVQSVLTGDRVAPAYVSARLSTKEVLNQTIYELHLNMGFTRSSIE